MKHFAVRFFAALLLALSFVVLPIQAQDAAMTLGLSVRFRTMKNTERMSDEIRKLVEELEARARTATTGQKYGEAIKHYARAMALIRNQPWTPSSLTLQNQSRLKPRFPTWPTAIINWR